MKALTKESANYLDLDITPSQQEAFEVYAALLVEWNARFNLTAIRDMEGIRTKHFLDSLSCLKVMDEPLGRVIDVGTGAGFPGLVLKIVHPEIHLTLVESVAKKTRFCVHVVETLGLDDVEILPERVETLGQTAGYREQYDWAVARALASMPVLAEYLLPLVRVGGRVLAQKGATAAAELKQAENALYELGGRLETQLPIRLPGVPDERYLVVLKKEKATPAAYPRRIGVPSKNPL